MPPTETRALLLDLDGTLADSLDAMKSVYRRFMEGAGLVPSDAEFNRLNGPPIPECIRVLKATHGLPQPEAELLVRYQALIEEVYGAVPPSPGARDLLTTAKTKGWTTGVVTSNGEARTRAWLARAGLDGLVDVVVGGDAVARGKPAPDPYLAALARTSCAPAAALAIEDSPQGAASARAAGIPTLALLRDPKHHLSGWPAGVDFVTSLADARKRIENDD
ncbi:MAG: HAD family phosphatase [Alphaproteobacteria bacterium]|nr:HAD family phosphatase [Alphaproteobacteria bacterium]MBM3950860.1 HAD family phosphatase [Rhodospirillales bacterium]